MTNKLNNYFQTIFRWIREKFNISEDNSVTIQNIELYSVALERQVNVQTLLPPGFSTKSKRRYPILLVNDGQDFEALQMKACLEALYQQKKLKPLLVFGIMAGDRMQEYGTATPTDYKNRGAKANVYTKFIINELLPHLHQQYPCKSTAKHQTFAGFSLGGLSALDIVWNHPQHFAQVGVFSGSLWWRSTPFNPSDPDADRIMHTMIQEGKKRAGLRFWLQTGTNDEQSDRNNNGVIDAIDDTLDLIEALKQQGYQDTDIRYVEVEGGEHNPATWGKVMGDFLSWI